MKRFWVLLSILMTVNIAYADYNSQMELFEMQRQKYYTRQQNYQNRVMQERQQQIQRQEEIRNRNRGLFEAEKNRMFGYTGVYYYDY